MATKRVIQKVKTTVKSTAKCIRLAFTLTSSAPDTLSATSPATLYASLPTLTPMAPTVSAPDIVMATLSWEAASSVSPSLQDALPPTSTTTSPAISSHSSDIFMSILSEGTLHPPDSGSRWKALGWKAYMQALGALKEVSVVFPLQAVTAGLLCMLEQIQEIKDTWDDLRVMARRIEALATLLRRYQGWTNNEDIHNRLDGMTASVVPVTKLAPGILNIITNSADAHDILECTQAVSFLITIFEVWLVLARAQLPQFCKAARWPDVLWNELLLSETRSNVVGIIHSIAFHLVLHSPPYAQAVIDAIKKAPGVSFNL
ncbi:hypothetical protein B0H10DRAFT_2324332 [Mycena sp. CBHHK59/15]|nr:hypothetical protein B0H10DRAFT_2324332 [Mycena sp. CBHHK59/15]